MSWSFSSWSTYDKCPAKYNYSYNLRLPRGPQSPSASRGDFIHKSFEAFLKKDLDKLPDEVNYYTQFLTSLRDDSELKLFPEYKVALNENWKQVEWDDPEAWYKGIFDLLVVHPNQLVVYDWKTGKEYDDHVQQREIYGLVALSCFEQYADVRAYHVYVDSRQTRPLTIYRSQMPTLRKSWGAKVHVLRGGRGRMDYTPYPGYYCRYCPYSSKFGAGPCRF